MTRAEKELKNHILDFVKQSIDQYSLCIEQDIKKKTIFYILWSLVGLLLLFFNFPKMIFWTLCVGMILSFAYINRNFIKSLKKILKFMDQFDETIKELVSQKIKTIEDQSVKNKIGLWLSGQNNKDIEDFCISYFIRELVQRFKMYKQDLLIRMVFYVIAVLLFREIFFSLFI